MSDAGSPFPGAPPPRPGPSHLPPPPPPNMAPPPGYVGYGTPQAVASGSFRRVGGVAKALGVLLIIYVPLQLLGVLSLFTLRDEARRFLDGEISESAFDDAAGANLGSLAGLLVIPIAVLTIILMYRMAANLRVLGRAGATWSPGWGIAGWFCPPCAIYAIPWLMFRELWKGSDPAVPAYDQGWKQGKVSPLVDVWWVLYGLVPLVGLVTSAGFIGSLKDFDTENVARRIDDYHVVNVVLALVSIVTAVVYLLVIRQLAARHMASTREA